MATITVLNSSATSLGGKCQAVQLAPPPCLMYRGARQEESESQDSIGEREMTSCHRHRRRSGKAGDHNHLVTLVYTICCIYQFISYLPLLILRVCFGSSQHPPDNRTRSSARHRDKPSLRTLVGLMLIGLPLMVLARLPIVGSLIALFSPPSPRESSRSRASSISSERGSRRSYSVCSGDSL